MTPTARRLGAALLSGSLGLVLVGRARAHGAGLEEFQAPLPLAFLLAGAAATIALTAVLLVAAGRLPDAGRQVARVSADTAGALRIVASLGFLLLVAAAVGHGLLGRQVVGDNLATVVVWPLWLKGVGFVAILAGSPWRVLSPWRTLYRGLCRLEGRALGGRTLPEAVGAWPALLGLVVLVGVVENLTGVPRTPAATAGVVAAYGAFVLGGSLVFGRAWFRRGDPLEVLYRLLGRVAPLQVVEAGGPVALAVRVPWRGTAAPVAHRTLAAVVVAAVYTVSFDGFVETPAYQDLLFAARAVAGGGPAADVALYAAGLVAFVAVFWAVAALTGRIGRFDAPALALVATVIPIAAAYEVAHNYPFVAANLGQLPHVFGGPAVNPLGWLSLPAFWASQVGLIVLGHVVAVIAAHQVVVRRVESPRRTLLAHGPMVVLMVGYTVLSLWIVSRPVVG